jgi:hypothetical protein
MSYPNYHTQLLQQEQALSHSDDTAWQEIVDLFPPETVAQARTFKAFLRANGLHDPLDLLRGIFSYVFCMGSFREVGAWALSTGLSENGGRMSLTHFYGSPSSSELSSSRSRKDAMS